MAGFCPKCSERFDVQGKCPNGHGGIGTKSAGATLVPRGKAEIQEIGPLPGAGKPRRLLGSGVEFFSYAVLMLILGVFDYFGFILLGAASAILALFMALRDCKSGAFSIAKRITQMRVVDFRTGASISNLRGFLRNSYYSLLLLLAALPWIDFAPGLLFLVLISIDITMVLLNPRGRRLGDLLARTQVVEERI